MRSAQAKRYATEVKKKNRRLNQNTLKLIQGTAEDIHKKVLKRAKPDIKLPVRSLSNVSYSQKTGYLQIRKKKKSRNPPSVFYTRLRSC